MYTEKIKQIFRDSIRQSWMDDDDFNEFETELLKQMGTSYEEMNKAVEVGIKNGYSFEAQMQLVIKLVKGHI